MQKKTKKYWAKLYLWWRSKLLFFLMQQINNFLKMNFINISVYGGINI